LRHFSSFAVQRPANFGGPSQASRIAHTGNIYHLDMETLGFHTVSSYQRHTSCKT
jgi:hypothetical protein